MRLYRFALAGTTTLLIGFGVVLAVFALPPIAALSLAALGAVATAALYPRCARAATALGVRLPDRVHACCVSAAVCSSLGGLVTFVGSAVWGGILVLALCWLPVLGTPLGAGFRRSWTAGVRGPTAHDDVAGFDEQLLRPLVAEWSDERLCDAWHRSFTRLHSDGIASTAALAQVRLVYLDELRARHPDEFDAWLRTGARSVDDPTRHLGRRSSGPAE